MFSVFIRAHSEDTRAADLNAIIAGLAAAATLGKSIVTCIEHYFQYPRTFNFRALQAAQAFDCLMRFERGRLRVEVLSGWEDAGTRQDLRQVGGVMLLGEQGGKITRGK